MAARANTQRRYPYACAGKQSKVLLPRVRPCVIDTALGNESCAFGSRFPNSRDGLGCDHYSVRARHTTWSQIRLHTGTGTRDAHSAVVSAKPCHCGVYYSLAQQNLQYNTPTRKTCYDTYLARVSLVQMPACVQAKRDIDDMVSWGIDHLKVDGCYQFDRLHMNGSYAIVGGFLREAAKAAGQRLCGSTHTVDSTHCVRAKTLFGQRKIHSLF